MVELEKLKAKIISQASQEGINLSEYDLEKAIKEGLRNRARTQISELNKLNYSFEEFSYANSLSENYKIAQNSEDTSEQDKLIKDLIEKVTPALKSEQIINKYSLDSIDSWTIKRTNPELYNEMEKEHKTQVITLKKDVMNFRLALRCNYTGNEYYKSDFNQFVQDLTQLLELNGVKTVLPLIPEENAWTLPINQYPKWENDNATITVFKNRNIKIKFKYEKHASVLNKLYKEKYAKYDHYLFKGGE